MKAIRIHEFGGPEVLTLDEVPMPQPGPGQALVQMRGAGINPYEAYIRQGQYTFIPPRPFILGGEGAGDVTAVGPGVTGVQVGDAVWGSFKGSHAEYALADPALLYPKPANVSYHEAAGLATAWATAVLGLVTLADMQPGETVVIHGASGGVGSAAVQLAHAWGARVIATVGSDAKAATARALGADETINYREQDLEAALKAAAPDGAQIVFDGVGAPVFVPSVRALASVGRYILYGGSGGRTITYEAPEFYRRNLTLYGYSAASHPRASAARATIRERIVPLLAAGQVRGLVDQVFPLAQAADAYRRLASREAQGKVIIDPTLG